MLVPASVKTVAEGLAGCRVLVRRWMSLSSVHPALQARPGRASTHGSWRAGIHRQLWNCIVPLQRRHGTSAHDQDWGAWTRQCCHVRRGLVTTAGADTVRVTVIDENGDRHEISGKVGTNLLDLCHQHKLELEGACDATLACSTCHVIIDRENYDKLDEPEDEELDMLDLAFGLEDTSRLGCQVILRPDLDGMVFRIPPPFYPEP